MDGSRTGGSTWQSLVRGTGSIETDHLNGEMVLLGRQQGVPTPVNEVLHSAPRARAHASGGSRGGSPPRSSPRADTGGPAVDSRHSVRAGGPGAMALPPVLSGPLRRSVRSPRASPHL
ncbi:hypothetical protein OHS70_07955 [Streptomyces sp. NBC_00390]